MRIVIYLEGAKVFSSGTPGRGMLEELIKLRNQDHFILVIRENSQANSIIQKFIESLKNYGNWSLQIEKGSSFKSNLLNLLHFPGYNSITAKGDVYINLDIDPLGSFSPIICTLADLSSIKRPEESSLNWIGRRIRKYGVDQMLKKADKVVCISDFTKEDLIEYKSTPSNQIQVIYNGIDSAWHNKSIESVDDQNYWIWWGYLSPRKNIERLLEAYLKLVDEEGKLVPDLKLVMSGRNNVIEKLKSKIPDYVDQKKIKIIPQLNLVDLIKMVDGSAGIVFPSLYEGFGMPVVESMARGKQVACSRIRALMEVSGNHAIYFDPYDVDSIKQGLLKLYKDPKPAKKTLKTKASHFTYSKAARNYSNLIDELVII